MIKYKVLRPLRIFKDNKAGEGNYYIKIKHKKKKKKIKFSNISKIIGHRNKVTQFVFNNVIKRKHNPQAKKTQQNATRQAG